MATKINVIKADNKVFATYVKTICFEAKLTGDVSIDDITVSMAKVAAFDYACNFGSCDIEIFNFAGANYESQDVFNFLDKQQPK